MASLTIKNIPERLLDRLRARAKADRRSVNQQLLYLLDRSLTVASSPARHAAGAEAEAQAQAWERLAGRWESDLPVREEIAAILNRRSGGRPVEL